MKIGETLKEIIKLRNYSYTGLANEMGYKHASAVANRLTDKSPMYVYVLAKMLEPLSCELVIRSKTKEKKEWVLLLEEEDRTRVNRQKR